MSEKKVTARMVEAMNAANLGEVDALLNANPDLDNQFQGGVLGWAKSADVARYFISRGRNLNSVHPRWGTPVARAIRDNNSDVVQVLLCSGARTDLDDCILCSAVQKSLALVQLLAEAGADIHEEYYASALG